MRVVLALTLALCSAFVCAAIITGEVYTREVIRDDNGHRAWVEYDPDTGEELRIVDPGEQAFPKISGGDARSGLWGGLTGSVIGGGIHDEISNRWS